MTCPMCGKATIKTFRHYYQYDNGEMFVNWVCKKCSDLHSQLLKTK